MSEGNISVHQARAMAERDISAASGAKPDSAATATHAADGAADTAFNPQRRLWPVYAAAVASVLWLMAVAGALYWAWTQNLIAMVTPADIAAGVAGLMTPIVCAWLMALVFQRTDPLLERRLALARTLNRAIAPIDAAEIKLNQLLERLRRDVDTVERTVELAAERIDTLEARFQSQVSDLFSATADAEAKAASIRDLLRRERESLDGLVSGLTDRAQAVETAIGTVAGRVGDAEQAAQRAADAIGARLETERHQLSAAMEGAAAQFAAITDDLGGRARALDSAAQQAEAILADRIASLDDGQEQYRATLEHLAARAESLRMAVARDMKALNELTDSADMKAKSLSETMAAGVDGLRAAIDAATAQSQSAAQHLADTTAQLDAQAGQTAQRLNHSASDLDAKLSAMLAQAQAMLAQTETTLDGQMGRIASHSEQAATLLADKLDMLERVAAMAASQLQEAIGNASQDAGTALAAARHELAGTADSLVNTAQDAASRVDAQMSGIADRLGAQLSGLADLALDNRQQIDALSDSLAERIGALSNLTAQARTDLSEANAAIDAQTTASSASFERMGATLSAFEHQIAERRDSLARMGNEVTDRINTALRNLSQQAAAIGGEVTGQVNSIDAESSRLSGQLEAMRDAFATAMAETQGAVENFRTTSTDLGTLASGNVEQLDQAARRLTGLGQETGKLQDVITSLTQTMTAEIDKIRTAVREASESADQGAVQVGATYLSAMARSRKISADAVEAARSAADNVVRMVEDTVSKTLETLRTQGGAQSAEAEQALTATAARISQSLNETLGQVGMAASRASVTAESAARRVASQAEGLLRETNDLANKMSAMEARLDTVVRSDLVRTSSLIIEGLNAAAVDIGRVLATDISDTQWRQYLAGDKSIFTRRTLKLGDGASRARISKRYDEDSDFRDHVRRFLRDFELLMARALAGKESTPLSIALLSSDLGKLYVLLAQSVKRLN